MTHDTTPTDDTDDDRSPATDSATDRRPAAQADATDNVANDRDTIDRDATESDGGLGSLVRGGAAALLGLTGLGAAGGTAAATQSTKHVVVVGYGMGSHSYEITMESGGTIQKAPLADGADSTGTNWGGDETASGEIWHWGVDGFAYTGEISSVEGDGTLAFHFEDGAFGTASTLNLIGNDSGKHRYAMSTPRGDIDLGQSTEGSDSDDGIGWADGERYWTQDRVSGEVWDYKYDSYDLGSDAVGTITVQEGTVLFYR